MPLSQSKVLIHLVECVVLSIECINDIFLGDIDLISDLKRVFNEVYELLHPLSE